MIAKCEEKDFNNIYNIINDAAIAYKGIIPEDRWHEPYMPQEELQKQINEGVEFWGYKENDEIIGVMGIQFKGDVTLIVPVPNAQVGCTTVAVGFAANGLTVTVVVAVTEQVEPGVVAVTV